MVREVDEQYWQKQISRTAQSVFYEPEFLNTIRDAFKYSLHYYTVEVKDKPVLRAALFASGGNIVIPIAFTYASVFRVEGSSDRTYVEATKELIRFLKTHYRILSFRLGTELNDLRPFLWSGFTAQLRYTYTKVPGSPVHSRVIKTCEKAMKTGLRFSAGRPSPISLTNNLSFMTKQGVASDDIEKYRALFINWIEMGVLWSFDVYSNDELLCSSLVLIDEPKSVLYTLLIHKTSNRDVHHFLGKEGLNWCESRGLSQVDYCGANIEGIAYFKSYLNPDLKPYFLVRFHPLEDQFKKFLSLMKRQALRFLRR